MHSLSEMETESAGCAFKGGAREMSGRRRTEDKENRSPFNHRKHKVSPAPYTHFFLLSRVKMYF